MKKMSVVLCRLLTRAALFVAAIDVAAQGTGFTYQGRLTDSGGAANGIYDLRFTIYAAPVGGTAVGGPVTNAATGVSNGLFTTTVDFGVGVFTGAERWLGIGVRTNGSVSDFTTVTPRQPIRATPYAIYSSASGSLSNGVIQDPAFFGTTGNTPLELFAGSQRILRLEPNIFDAPNVIGGSSINQVDPGVLGATIGGGGANSPGAVVSNRVANGFGTIGGGYGNLASGYLAVIGGGALNAAEEFAAVIGGGYGNNIQAGAGFSSIGGGIQNVIGTNAPSSHVGAGSQNVIQQGAAYASIVGGQGNTNGASHSVLGGGLNNWIEPSGDRSVIGGGWYNYIQGGADESVIAGGNAGKIFAGARESFIGGGFANTIGTNSGGSHVGGGVANTIGTGSFYSSIGGGNNNSIQDGAQQTVIGGGAFNQIRSSAFQSGIMSGNINSISNGSAFSVIVGGVLNHIGDTATYASIGGGQYNTIRPFSHDSTIAGGLGNRVFSQSQAGTIAGGRSNAVAGFGFVGGGDFNTNRGFIAAIGGGRNNQIGPLADHSVIAGGGDNEIVGSQTFALYGVISGGQSNSMQTNAIYSVIGGGAGNTIRSNAQYTTIPGGASNAAGGRFSFAAGRRAQALHDGSFVWADATDADFASTTSNQFNIRAAGGVRVETTGTATLNGQPILAGTVPSSSLSGTYANAVTFNNPANSFTGNGAGLTGLNASSLSSGTVSDARLSGNVALLNGNQTFVGVNTFNHAANSFTGNGAGLTSLNASSLASGTVSDARLSGNVALLNVSQTFFADKSFSGNIFLTDATKSIQFPGINGATAPMIYLYSSGIANSPRMVFAHSPSFANWGLQYEDAPDRFHFLSNGVSIMTVDLGLGRVGIGTSTPSERLHVIGNILATGTITPNSDRNAKTDFAAVDTAAMLDRVAKLSIQQWRFKTEAENVKHVGPMAQDFRAAFGLGAHETAIATVDADGVALAAIQGLHDLVKEKDAKITALEERLAKIERMLSKLTTDDK